MTGDTPGYMPAQRASAELSWQLALLQNTQELVGVILAALVWQYQALHIQQAILLDNAAGRPAGAYPDPTTLRLSASLMTLYALFGLQRQSTWLAARSRQAGEKADWVEPALGALVIGIALIRYIRLVQTQGNAGAPQSGQAIPGERALQGDLF